MSDFCDFVPDDPSCAPPADPDTPIDDGDDHMEEHMDDGHEMMDSSTLMQAQVAYLMTAMSLTVHAALVQFRYRSSDTFYDAGDALTTNYWELLNMLWNYFTIGWMGIATITQLLSMLGIAAEINLMVWMYGGIVNMVVSFISGLVAMYAYDAYWSVSEDSTSSE